MKLTKQDIDVIICLLDDMYELSGGLKPEECELYERLITREENDND